MDMIIKSEPEIREVDDYDFTFAGGILMPVTIDKAAGDTIFETPAFTKIYLCEKPSPSTPGSTLPAEEITIFNSQLLSIQHRTRAVTLLSEEQKIEWGKFMKAQGGGTRH